MFTNGVVFADPHAGIAPRLIKTKSLRIASEDRSVADLCSLTNNHAVL
jgi:hypothetical protein